MRLVVDTNVLFSALYDLDSVPGQLLTLAIEGALELFAPEKVRRELESALRTKLGYTEAEWDATAAALPVEWVEAPLYDGRLAEALEAIKDPDDAPIVALALSLRADIVSGDRAFHPLRKPVVKAWKPREVARTGGRPDATRRSGAGARRAGRRRGGGGAR